MVPHSTPNQCTSDTAVNDNGMGNGKSSTKTKKSNQNCLAIESEKKSKNNPKRGMTQSSDERGCKIITGNYCIKANLSLA